MFDDLLAALETLNREVEASGPTSDQWSDLIDLAERMFRAAGAS